MLYPNHRKRRMALRAAAFNALACGMNMVAYAYNSNDEAAPMIGAVAGVNLMTAFAAVGTAAYLKYKMHQIDVNARLCPYKLEPPEAPALTSEATHQRSSTAANSALSPASDRGYILGRDPQMGHGQ